MKFVRSFAGVGLDSASFCPLSVIGLIGMKPEMGFEEIASPNALLSLPRWDSAYLEGDNQKKEVDWLAQLHQQAEHCSV